MGAPQQALSSYGAVVGTTYATWNPADKSADITLSLGNLKATQTTSSWDSVRSTIGKTSGKWYWEYTMTWSDWFDGIGNSSATLTNHVWFDANWRSYYFSDWSKVNNNTYTAYWATWNGTSVISVALDMNAGTLIFYKNNVSQGTAFTWLSGTIYAMIGVYGNTTSVTANFGATAQTYSPPSGYNAGLYS